MTQPASNATYDEDGVYWLRDGDVVDSKGRRVTIAGNLGIVQLLNERAELRQQVRVAHKRLLALLPNASETETLASLVHRLVELSSIPSAIPNTHGINIPPKLHPKTAQLVLRFATALAEKLQKAEDKYGYDDGWSGSAWMEECQARLLEHVQKGDPRDVAAYCAFMWHHGWSTRLGPKSPQPSTGRPERWVP